MKYGIIVNSIVTEPTDIPPSGQANPVAWLEKYRFAGAWVQVSDDAVPGATYNGGGSSTNPPEPPQDLREYKLERGRRTHIAMVRARAADLRNKGRHLESLSLLKTIGE